MMEKRIDEMEQTKAEAEQFKIEKQKLEDNITDLKAAV